jgi:hypothetical protein
VRDKQRVPGHVGEEMNSFDLMTTAIDWLDAYRAGARSSYTPIYCVLRRHLISQ